MTTYKERLAAAVKATKTALCVGIDPHTDAPTRAFLEDFGKAHVDAAAALAPAVKFQAAFYEALGSDGVAVLERSVRYARDKGLLVILDAKRGDISSTMKAYGVMAFDSMGADALTVTPYMGMDVVEPLRPWLEKGRGIYVVWVSSNPSGSMVQDAIAAPLLTEMERQMAEWKISGALGLVLGATKVEALVAANLFARVKDHALLMPGVGAQGGEVTPRLRELFASGCGLVPLSRALSFPLTGPSPTNWLNYTEVLRGRIRDAVTTLSC